VASPHSNQYENESAPGWNPVEVNDPFASERRLEKTEEGLTDDERARLW
jgi:hypothetical protein